MMGCNTYGTMYSNTYNTRMTAYVTYLKYDMYIGVYNTHFVQVCMKTLGRCLAGQLTGWLHRSGSRISNHG